MAFITEVVTPIVKTFFLVAFAMLWIWAGIWLLKKYAFTKRVRLWIKYHIFRKKYDEEIVQWCLDAYEKGHRDEMKVKKFLLLKSKFPLKKIEEILFIFSEITKLKGGYNKKDGRIRQSSGEIEFPKAKEKNH